MHAAARMQAAKALNRTIASTANADSDSDSELELELESESDCNYIGGVAYSAASSDNDSDTGSESEWSDDDSSDMKSMDELEGDKLEENLKYLREKAVAESPKTSLYEKIAAPKEPKHWRMAERNRSLGYSGLSKRSQQRHLKKA